MGLSKKASLVFDIDNTLVDRDGAFLRWMQQMMQTHAAAFAASAEVDQVGQVGQVGEPGAVAGMDEAGILETIQALDAHGKTERTLFCQQLLQAFPALPYSPESLWQAHQVLPQFVQADDALLALLPRLAQRYQLMILSNGSGSMQRQKLQQAHLSAFFDPVFISGEVGYAKPDARLFAHARRACTHETVVMIGDDYHNDMAPALALGWQTIFINPRQQSLPFQAALKPQRELANIYALEEALACMI